jgi:hypothetical protein
MLQRYKLRLGDGTVLSVDEDALKTWQEDGRAMVQAVGTQEWRPLRELLSELDSAARLARALVPPRPRQDATTTPPAAPGPRLEPPEPAPAARPSLQVLADDLVSSRSAGSGTAPASDDGMPIIRMKPLDDEPSQPAAWSARQDENDDESAEDVSRHDRLDGPLLSVLEVFGGFLSRCLDPLTPLVRRSPSTPSVGATKRPPVATPAPAPLRPQAPLRREPHKAPVPVSELPVLRLADSHDPEEDADIYEGETAESLFHPIWRWTKRIVVLGGLAALVLVAASTWESWFPKAADLGQTVFTAIDRQARSRERADEQQRALADAAARLPYLAPETVRLLFAASPAGVLDAPDVFELAGEAAERGRVALTPPEAEELAALRRELVEALRPAERQLVREYERARSRRAIFPFENQHVLDLVARGARALPPPSLERLQTLYGKAVAAGLALPTGAAASPGAAAR